MNGHAESIGSLRPRQAICALAAMLHTTGETPHVVSLIARTNWLATFLGGLMWRLVLNATPDWTIYQARATANRPCPKHGAMSRNCNCVAYITLATSAGTHDRESWPWR